MAPSTNRQIKTTITEIGAAICKKDLLYCGSGSDYHDTPKTYAKALKRYFYLIYIKTQFRVEFGNITSYPIRKAFMAMVYFEKDVPLANTPGFFSIDEFKEHFTPIKWVEANTQNKIKLINIRRSDMIFKEILGIRP